MIAEIENAQEIQKILISSIKGRAYEPAAEADLSTVTDLSEGSATLSRS